MSLDRTRQPTAGVVPVGGIIMWSGTIASIPVTWALCDGTLNTPGPDLRDKFVVGAKQDEASVAKTNLTGALTSSGVAAVSAHTLTTNVSVADHTLSTNVAIDAHTLSTNVAIADHTLTTSAARTSTASSRAFVTTAGAVAHTITQPVVAVHAITQPVVSAHAITQPVVAAHTSVWPAYYALAFIQRMS
jgi:microcystin-dependent protein